MEELGYLDDPADRLGMLDGQRMRAARVVLDIGVHLGKQRPDGDGPVGRRSTRSSSCGRNVNMNDGFVRFEVNRYLGWPGQAPSYKVGQRIWEQMRDEVRTARGGGVRHQGVPQAARSTSAASASTRFAVRCWPERPKRGRLPHGERFR